MENASQEETDIPFCPLVKNKTLLSQLLKLSRKFKKMLNGHQDMDW